MQVTPLRLTGVVEIVPAVHSDPRGYFLETYQQMRFSDHGIVHNFVQENLSYSVKNTVRGLHLQHPNDQGKLIQVIKGEIFDVAVDVRKGSSTFGQWIGGVLSDSNTKQLFIPQGFAHGFCVISRDAYVLYKCTDYYAPENELGILWNDPFIGIQWPTRAPLLSSKDAHHLPLKEINPSKLPSL